MYKYKLRFQAFFFGIYKLINFVLLIAKYCKTKQIYYLFA